MCHYETVNVDRMGSVAVVSLNRPDSVYAFDACLRRDLLRAVRDVNGDEAVNILDVVYLINFKYKSGDAPGCPVN